MLFPEREVNSRKKILKIIKDPKMGRVVNDLREKNELISQFKKYSPGGISKDEARRMLGKFRYDKKDSLTGEETAGLAKALGISGSHKYTRPDKISDRKTTISKFERDRDSNSFNKSSSSTSSKSRGFSKMSPLH